MISAPILSSLIFIVAILEFVFAIYLWLANPRSAANRSIFGLLALFGLSTLSVGILSGTQTLQEAELWQLLRVAMTSMVGPALMLTTLAIVRPGWLRWWVRWPLILLLWLPAVSVALDAFGISQSLIGTNLIYSAPDPVTYPGGVTEVGIVSAGLLRIPFLAMLFGLTISSVFIPLLWAAIRDRQSNPGRSQAAWILFGVILAVIGIQTLLGSSMGFAAASLIANILFFAAFMIILVRATPDTTFGLNNLRHTFAGWPIFTKLMVIMLTILLPILASISFVTFSFVRASLTEQVGVSLLTLANNEAATIGDELIEQFDHLERLNTEPGVLAEISERNIRYAGLSGSEIESRINGLENEWQSSELMESLLEESQGFVATLTEFSNFSHAFPEHSRLLLTDRQGALVTASSVPENYDFSSTVWWHAAFNGGGGANYVGEPYFDTRSGQYQVELASPVYDDAGSTVVGVTHSIYVLTGLLDQLENTQIGTTGGSTLYDASGRFLDPVDRGELAEIPFNWSTLLSVTPRWNVAYFNDADFVVASATVAEQSANSTVAGVNWRVLTVQSTDEALTSLVQAGQLVVLTLFGSALFAVLLLVLLARLISRPLAELTQVAEQISEGDLDVAAVSTGSDEIGLLATSFNMMTQRLKDMVSGLENQVSSRTSELEGQAAALAAAAEIGREISAIRDRQVLFNQVTQLVSQRFSFYHSGIYLLDERKESLALVAANSPEGQEMVERGHQRPLSRSGLLGEAIESDHFRKALNRGQEQVYFDTPELNEMKSALALPLKAGNELIGVLDIQCSQPNAFAESDLATLQLVAAQLGTAMENAELFQVSQNSLAESESALDAARRAYEQLSQAGWSELQQARPDLHFLADAKGVKASSPESNGADPEDKTTPESDPDTVILPIRIREHVAGRIRLKKSSSDTWNDNERELTEAISAQLSQALESARLFQDTQRRSLQLQTSAEVAQAASSLLELDELLQVTTTLMLEKLSLYYVGVFLVDIAREYAILYMGTGEAGLAQVAAGHRLFIGGESMIGQAIYMGTAQITQDVQLEQAHFQNPHLPETRSEMALPLVTRGETIGALTIQSTQPGAFSGDDITALQTMANQLANAVQNASLFQESQHLLDSEQRQRLLADRLARVGGRMAETLSELDLRDIMVREVHDVVLPDQISMYETTENGSELRLVVRQTPGGSHDDYEVGHAISRNDRPDLWQVLESQESILDTKIVEDDQTQEHYRLPWFIGVSPMGVIELIHTSKEASIREEDQAAIEGVVQQAALALQSARNFEQTQAALSRTEALFQVSQSAISFQQISEVLRSVVREVAENLPADRVTLLTFDERTREVTNYLGGGPGVRNVEFSTPYDEIRDGLSGWVIQNRVPAISPNGLSDPREGPDSQKRRQETNSGSILVVPLLYQERVVGTMTAINTPSQRDFTTRDAELMSAMANQAAAALANSELFFQLQARATQLQTAAEVSQAASSLLDLTILLPQAVELIRERFELYYVGVFLVDEPGRWADLRAGSGEAGQRQIERNHRLRIGGDSMIGQCIQINEAQISSDVGDESLHFSNPDLPLTRSELALPLRARGTTIGAVTVQSENSGAFSEVDQTTLQTMADQLANAIDNARLIEQTGRQNRELAILNQMTGELTALLDIQAIANLVQEYTAKLLTADAYLVALFDEGSQMVEFPVVVEEGKHLSLPRVATGNGLTDYVLRTKKALLLPDRVLDRARELGVDVRLEGEPAQSWLAAPMLLGDRVIGAIICQSITRPNQYEQRDTELLSNIASQAAVSLQNATLFGESRRLSAQLQSAAEIARDTSETLAQEELLRRAVNLIQERFGYYHAGIFLMDDTRQFAIIQEATGEAGAEMRQRAYKLAVGSQSVIGNVTYTGKSLLVNDVTKDSIYRANPLLPDTSAQLGIPLKIGQRILGALDVHSTQFDAFSPDDVAVLQTLADQIAVAVDNARSFELVQRSTETARARVEELSTLFDFSQTMSGIPLQTEEIAETTILRMVEILGGATSCGLSILNTETGTMEVVADLANKDGQQIFEEDPSIWNFQLDEYPATKATMDSLRPTLIQANDPDADAAEVAYLEEIGAETLLIIPLAAKGEAFGVIELDKWGDAIDFTQDQLNFAMTVANQAAAALDNARSYELAQEAFGTARSRVQELSTLFDASQTLSEATMQSKEIAEIAVQKVIDAVGGGTSSSLAIHDPEEDIMHTLAELNIKEGKIEMNEDPSVWDFRLSDYPATQNVMRTLEPLTFHENDPNTDTAELNYLRAVGADSMLILPLAIKGEAFGVVEIESSEGKREFTDSQINLAMTIVNQTAAALENARLYEEQIETAEQLRELDQLKNQFLANMSHELRTPLNSIIGFSRVILKGIDGPVTDLQEQDLNAIYNAGNHLLGLINDILDLSRIDAGKMELNFEEVDIGSLVSSVLSTARGLVKEKPVQLKQDIQEDIPAIFADPTRIRQVFLNLLQNAAKFTDEGSITLIVRSREGESGAPEVYAAVEDTGIGISDEDKAKLFVPFSQVDSSATRKSGGTGLGLSISRNLIELHGGHIDVESEVGKGSTFYFTIPALPSTQALQVDEETRTVLAIDDDPKIITLYRRYLEPEGFNIISLTNPAQALDAARKYKPYAITLDIRMPNQDGWDVLKALKQHPETAHIPVIFCTIEEERAKAMQLGASEFLLKPVLKEELLSALMDSQEGASNGHAAGAEVGHSPATDISPTE